MHVELLVEEPSTEAALENLLPRILPTSASYRIHAFQGKQSLISALPGRLRGYASVLPNYPDWFVVILVDADNQECHELKSSLEQIALQATLSTKTHPDKNNRYHVINRIAIEELEAWFFGDVAAMRREFPRLPRSLPNQKRYRDPDSIGGGTWEALERLLTRHKYYSTVSGAPKIEVARRISTHMIPAKNNSRSFQVFRDALLGLSAQSPA